MIKILQKFISIITWLQIAISPILLGLLFALILYFSLPRFIGLIFAIIVAITGFIIGIIWAEKAREKIGTVQYMSRIIATPELDENISDSKNGA